MWLVITMLLNSTIVFTVFWARHRLNARVAATLVAAAFGMTTTYGVWRVEWFDVYRHGMPPIVYVLKTVGVYTLSLSITGWLVGHAISLVPKARRQPA